MTLMIKLIMPRDGGWEKKKREGSLSSSRSLNLISRRWRISGAVWQADTMSVCCKISALLWKCVWGFVEVQSQASKATWSTFPPSFPVYMLYVTSYVMASPAVSTAYMRACIVPDHPHALPIHPCTVKAEKQENIKTKNAFFFNSKPHQEAASAHSPANMLQWAMSPTIYQMWIISTTCFYFLSLWKHAAPSPGTVIDTSIQALGIGVKHDWFSWVGF